MKEFKIILTMCVLVFFTNSCKDDFDLPADWKDIPIVYGILQVGEENHYIRIEKAFLDPGLSPLETAQIADSLYYDDAVVEIANLDNGRVVTMQRVNAEDEGFERKNGVFASEPNYIYKVPGLDLGLVGGETVELRINRGDNKEIITSTTTILPPMSITKPIMPSISKWSETVKVDFSWKPETLDAALFDMEIVFKYQERIGDNPVELKTISWSPVRNKKRTNEESTAIQLNERISGASFYQFVGEAIDETVLARRIPVGIDLFVYGGGNEIKDFFEISLANTGVTGSQDPPIYTNISGDGRGIFSSKSVAELRNITLQREARDSLLFGRFTRDLRFE